jgi:hypothetical protein
MVFCVQGATGRRLLGCGEQTFSDVEVDGAARDPRLLLKSGYRQRLGDGLPLLGARILPGWPRTSLVCKRVACLTSLRGLSRSRSVVLHNLPYQQRSLTTMVTIL